jgi:hypothetical protein
VMHQRLGHRADHPPVVVHQDDELDDIVVLRTTSRPIAVPQRR